MNNQNKKNSVPGKKLGIADEIDKLNQRREDRKNKGPNDDRKGSEKVDNGKLCDAEYENMIRKKKLSYHTDPENVNLHK